MHCPLQILAALCKCADDITQKEVTQALVMAVGEGESMEEWVNKMLSSKKGT